VLESYLSEILVRRGVVTEERLKPFFAQQRENGPSLMDLLLAGNVADAGAVAQALADECGFPYLARIDIAAVSTPVASPSVVAVTPAASSPTARRQARTGCTAPSP